MNEHWAHRLRYFNREDQYRGEKDKKEILRKGQKMDTNLKALRSEKCRTPGKG